MPLAQVPEKAKFSGIMTRPKPNGSVRIILNLSAPLGRAVNEGINNNQFPTSMSSTTKWLRVLRRAGKHAKMCKVDWSDVYKHVTVRAEDTDLQWFQRGGQAFKELCLIYTHYLSVLFLDFEILLLGQVIPLCLWSRLGFQLPSLPGFLTQFRMIS